MLEELDSILYRNIVRRLDKKEKVKSFDCGDADLNDFILCESPMYLIGLS